MFFESVKDSDLKRELWKNIIVVDNDIEKSAPRLVSLKEIIDTDIEAEVVHVGNEYNSYEFGSYNILNMYDEHELIKESIAKVGLPPDRIEITKSSYENVASHIKKLHAASAWLKPCF